MVRLFACAVALLTMLGVETLSTSGLDWYDVSGVSACYDATFNGTVDLPFLGMTNVSSECRALCEAYAGCTAYCGAGTSPHVSPTGQDWRQRCYGRLDTKWKLTPMVDEYAGCNYKLDPTGCPNPSNADAVVVDVSTCLYRNGSPGECRTASRVGAGVLLSINETHPKDSLIAPLRLHAHRGDWDHTDVEYARLQRLGFKTVQLLLPDMYVPTCACVRVCVCMCVRVCVCVCMFPFEQC